MDTTLYKCLLLNVSGVRRVSVLVQESGKCVSDWKGIVSVISSGKVNGIRRGVCVSGVRRECVTRIKRGKCTWGKKRGSVSWLTRGSVPGTEMGKCTWDKKGNCI